eukprot:gnl/MRDRNA2_/MRDRNA2_174353_c0_seq1.p1 gnl/MRDRNA2_/MRDRNA2_174353_c0~~gnl/MRDRNA2_/MRDRNA2_174353_c0_seq1.p1  ORF type:complete len:568 (-),score=44.10 gnl/MRDRNA2_/MRDRNA2_174353_c0_seq1:5-1456(-)
MASQFLEPSPRQTGGIKLPDQDAVRRHVRKFARCEPARSYRCLAITVFACIASSWLLFKATSMILFEHIEISFAHSVAVLPVLLVLAALSRVRLFIIFHDCTHSSFLPGRKANALLGTFLGCCTWSAFRKWRDGHLFHHVHSNNLDEDQFAQSAPWTLQSLLRAPYSSKMHYLWMNCFPGYFCVLPIVTFAFFNRFLATRVENLGLLAWICSLWCLGGFTAVHLEVLTIGVFASIGHVCFHAQHTFEGSYKARGDGYSSYANCLLGCSFLILPRWLKWFALGIEYHHLHHLDARIPCYRLEECHNAADPEMWSIVPTFGLRDVLNTLHFSVYDELSGIYRSVLEPAILGQLLFGPSMHSETSRRTLAEESQEDDRCMSPLSDDTDFGGTQDLLSDVQFPKKPVPSAPLPCLQIDTPCDADSPSDSDPEGFQARSNARAYYANAGDTGKLKQIGYANVWDTEGSEPNSKTVRQRKTPSDRAYYS